MDRRIALILACDGAAAVLAACGGGSASGGNAADLRTTPVATPVPPVATVPVVPTFPLPTPIEVLEPASPLSVVELLQSQPEFSIFVEAIAVAEAKKLANPKGTLSSLKTAGPHTLLAPTNAAFASLFAELGKTKDEVFDNGGIFITTLVDQLRVSHYLFGDNLSKAQMLKATGVVGYRTNYQVFYPNGVVVFNDQKGRAASVTKADVRASNGTIHVIDHVLLRAFFEVEEEMQLQPQFSFMYEAMVASARRGGYNIYPPYFGITLFAPTNTAWADFLVEMGITKKQLLDDPAWLRRLIAGGIFAYQSPKSTLTKLELNTVWSSNNDVSVDANGHYLNVPTRIKISPDLTIIDEQNRRINIIATDLQASGTVIHTIDKVILIPREIGLPDLTVLDRIGYPNSFYWKCLEGAGLAELFLGSTPLTVFSFDEFLFGNVTREYGVTAEAFLADKALLTKVMKYQVVLGKFKGEDLARNGLTTTLLGETFHTKLVDETWVCTDQRGREMHYHSSGVLGCANGTVFQSSRLIAFPSA